MSVNHRDPVTGNLTPVAGNSAQLTNSIVAEDFSTSKAYAIGDWVIYNSTLYRFTSAHAAGAWNASEATATDVEDEVAAVKAVIPAAQVNADWNASSGVAKILNKPTLPSVFSEVALLYDGTTGAAVKFTVPSRDYYSMYVIVPTWTKYLTDTTHGMPVVPPLILPGSLMQIGSATSKSGSCRVCGFYCDGTSAGRQYVTKDFMVNITEGANACLVSAGPTFQDTGGTVTQDNNKIAIGAIYGIK